MQNKGDLYIRKEISVKPGQTYEVVRRLRQEVGVEMMNYIFFCTKPNKDNEVDRILDNKVKQLFKDIENLQNIFQELMRLERREEEEKEKMRRYGSKKKQMKSIFSNLDLKASKINIEDFENDPNREEQAFGSRRPTYSSLDQTKPKSGNLSSQYHPQQKEASKAKIKSRYLLRSEIHR